MNDEEKDQQYEQEQALLEQLAEEAMTFARHYREARGFDHQVANNILLNLLSRCFETEKETIHEVAKEQELNPDDLPF